MVSARQELSSAVSPGRLPGGRPADILVTETFGTMLLGEGAANFVPDSRDRLLKREGGVATGGGWESLGRGRGDGGGPIGPMASELSSTTPGL